MNARNQLLVVLTALMLVCSSGAMAVGAAPTTVDGQSQDDGVLEGETATNESDQGVSTANETVDENQSAEVIEGDQPADENVSVDENQTVNGTQGAVVEFSDQTTEGETVVVDQVTMASGGFVTIHNSSLLAGNVFGSVIGTSTYLEAGTHENVEITLDQPLEEDETLIAMPHRDTNANQTYDFVESEGAEDIPYLTPADEPVTDDAVVTVGTTAEEPADNETQQPIQEEPTDNETQQPIEEEPADNETEQPVEEEPTAEEPVGEEPVDNETEQPIDNETEQPVDEQPVEEPIDNETQQPVEEPAEETPEEVSVVIEEATIFVFIGGHSSDGSANQHETGVQVDGVTVENGTDTASDTAVGTNDATRNGLNDSGHASEQRVEVTMEQVTVVPGHHAMSDCHAGMNDTQKAPHAGMNGSQEAPAEETGETGTPIQEEPADNETQQSVNAGSEATASGGHQIVIEEATVFVFIENVGALPEQPADEEPAEEPTDNETQQPILEEPVDNETQQPVDNETQQPILEEPTDNETQQPTDNETEQPILEEPTDNETQQPTDNETEQPILEEPTDNETQQPVDNETEQPILEEPTDNETQQPTDNETEQPILEEPTDNETQQPTDNETQQPVGEEPSDAFVVENLEGPATLEVGESATVTATVSNPTDGELTETVQFRLDGDLVESQEVTLGAGETTQVEFEVDTADLEPGQYVHMVLSETSGEVATLEVTAESTGGVESGLEGDLENGTAENHTTGNESATNVSATAAVAGAY